jgi:hypothetical protein
VPINKYDSLYSNNSSFRTDRAITSHAKRLNMLLNSAKIFAGVMLMIGAAQAQVGNNDAQPPLSVGAIRDPNLRPWPPSAGQGGHVVIPQSSIPGPEDAGKRAHTNTRILVPNGPTKPHAAVGRPLVGPSVTGFFFETPASPSPASMAWSL